jgi:DNA-binding MarR family transcriptional regulator
VVRAVADLVGLIEPRLLSLWQELGMTLSQRRVLRRLREGPRSAGDVAESLGISAPSMTRMLSKLEQRGLIVRTLDQEDRRRVQVELTGLGTSSLEDHRVFAGTSLVHAARSLSADQQRTTAEAIDALVRSARELEAGQSVD